MQFNGMLKNLWNWAHEEGFLPGQRARNMQPAQVELRNMVAHPSGYHLGTPVDAARVIRDLAEIVNCLWGARTPSGRLHPAPVHRFVQLIVWDDTGRVEIGDVSSVPTGHMTVDAACLVVRAQVDDRDESCSGSIPGLRPPAIRWSCSGARAPPSRHRPGSGPTGPWTTRSTPWTSTS
ncbi:hypothetical protein ACRAKI_22595 [Saccharothrix isguenensis]